MAENDILKRYLDAGMAFTQLSRERAEEFVKDLVKAGEVRRKETEEVIETLLERSRKNTEDLMGMIRSEIADQLRNLGLEDVAKRAGLSSTVTDAADKVDGAVEQVAEVVDRGPKVAAKKAATVKKAAKTSAAPVKTAAPVKSAAKKAPAAPAKKSAAPAKKLIVPPSAATGAAPAKKVGAAKKTAPKKS